MTFLKDLLRYEMDIYEMTKALFDYRVKTLT